MPNTSKTILIVDDDPKIRNLLRNCLESDGFNIIEAASSAEVDRCLASSRIDLITLDLQLGSESGLAIAAHIRATTKTPIIMVTGKNDVIDKIVGLEMGADDYIAKPFHLREVLARVHSVLRRSEATPALPSVDSTMKPNSDNRDEAFEFDGWIMSSTRYELKDPAGEMVNLTTAEFKLLMIFLNNPRRILSRETIMNHINGFEWEPNDRTIDNQIARLRKRIEVDAANPKIIKTIRGIGYMLASNVSRLK